MSALTAKLAAVRNNNQQVMYSAEGAQFQEWALNNLDSKGSAAHMMIGKLVTMINNNQISVSDAVAQYSALLVK